MNVNMKRSGLGVEFTSPALRGEGAQMESAEFVQRIEIEDDGQREGLIVIVNKGDSMEKLIMDGSTVVVDVYQRTIVSGSVYALSIPWEGCVFRECQAEPGGLILKPYNQNYPVTYVDWEEFKPDMVIGKVFCSILNVFR